MSPSGSGKELSVDELRVLRPVERSLIVRALRALAVDTPLLENHRKMALELAEAIDDAGGVLLTDSEGPY